MSASPALRVLMSVDAVGGVWTYALDLAAGLAAHGVTVVFAVLGPPPDTAQRAAAAGIAELQLVVLDQPLEWLAGSATEIEASGAALEALASRTGVDLVHLNTAAPAATARFPVPVLITCHSCLATWWATMQDGPPPTDFAWRKDLVGRGYRAADLLVAPTRWFAEATRAAYDLRSPPLVVLNGRRRHGVQDTAGDAPVAFTAGRLWDPGKGAATLDATAALLPFPILAAGPVEGPQGARFAPHHLHLAGRLDTAGIAVILEKRPIFVSAARYEPFGLAVLEAAQAGCPLVLADTPGFRELWDGAAVFVPPEDAASYAMAITALADDRERHTALGVAAQERAGRYDLSTQVAAILAAYRQILGRTGRNVAA